MQLNQPIPPTPSGGQDPYDFILANNQKPKSKLSAKTSSKKGRLLVVAAGAALLLIVFGIIINLMGSAGANAKAQIIAVAQSQNELARVATLGSTQAQDIPVQNFATTVAVTITTGQSQTISYLKGSGTKVSSKQLAFTKDTNTDKALKTAASTNTYDQKLTSVLEDQLQAYQLQLIKAYKSAETPKQKKLLQQLSDDAAKLAKNQPTTN